MHLLSPLAVRLTSPAGGGAIFMSFDFPGALPASAGVYTTDNVLANGYNGPETSVTDTGTFTLTVSAIPATSDVCPGRCGLAGHPDFAIQKAAALFVMQNTRELKPDPRPTAGSVLGCVAVHTSLRVGEAGISDRQTWYIFCQF